MSLGRCLVIDINGAPVEVCSCEDAIWDIMKGNAVLLESAGRFCHSPSTAVEIPSVIQQIKWHKMNTEYYESPRQRSLPLTPRNVCARDRWICGYQIEGLCSGRATTIDHIVPRSKGGANTWENVTAACRPCNHKKGSKSLEDLGWELKNTPWRPTGALARVLVHSGGREEWLKYLK